VRLWASGKFPPAPENSPERAAPVRPWWLDERARRAGIPETGLRAAFQRGGRGRAARNDRECRSGLCCLCGQTIVTAATRGRAAAMSRPHHPGRSRGGAVPVLNAGRTTPKAIKRPARTGLSYSEVLLKLQHRPCVVDTPWTESARTSPIRPAGPTAPTGSRCASTSFRSPASRASARPSLAPPSGGTSPACCRIWTVSVRRLREYLRKF
jgi:hypothetical protein